ncbi:MAG TPA: type II toxin-antitoxin system VapB family antitoxin [Solirubrobacterales bacterium]|nr:type II toxin-antitoxin system VapB family antitoxin [Solirubrobacterales bacterium]
MALNIKDPKTDRLARELADLTGESITVAVGTALKDRLERLSGSVPSERRADEMLQIAKGTASLPVLDTRSEDEILGYGDSGLPE